MLPANDLSWCSPPSDLASQAGLARCRTEPDTGFVIVGDPSAVPLLPSQMISPGAETQS
jgi:hypothetical protein